MASRPPDSGDHLQVDHRVPDRRPGRRAYQPCLPEPVIGEQRPKSPQHPLTVEWMLTDHAELIDQPPAKIVVRGRPHGG
jgi:hypothetical protein